MANKQKLSKSELESDSGFSDSSSGYLSALDQSEFEDLRSSTPASQNIQSSPRVPCVSGSPVVKINNIVLKQASSLTPPWGFHPSLEMVPQSPSVVLLQPVVPSSICTSQISMDQQRQSKNCIPFMNSILKNSQHHAHGAAGNPEQSTIHKSSLSHIHAGSRRRHNDKQFPSVSLKKEMSENTVVGSSVDSCLFSHTYGNMYSSSKICDPLEHNAMDTPVSICTDSALSLFPEACNKAKFAFSEDAKDFPVDLSPSCSKRKRFCNTYNILNRSGLLGITMRTKELIRQNKRSQAQLQKLQAHTDLFLEAMSSRDPQVWGKLQLTLQNTSSEDPKEDTVGNTGLDAKAIECM